MKICLLACASLLASFPSLAQGVAPAQPAMLVVAPAVSQATLRMGTEIPLRLLEDLTTKGKMLRAGARVRMETAEAVVVQSNIVVPAGSPAVGEITNITNKGMWGKSGHLSGRPLYVSANGRQIRVSGSFDDKGIAGGVGAVAVSAIVFLPAGFVMTGTSAKLPMGTVVRSFVEEDIPLQIAGATPVQPLIVAPITAPAAMPTATGVKLVTVSVPATAVVAPN